MALPLPENGLVICYSYLWDAESRKGREEGAKDRPCAIILTTRRAEAGTVVTVVPVTHTCPQASDEAVEIPLKVKRSLGLDDARSWIVVNEVNRFVWPGSDLRPISRHQADRFEYGFLPPYLFRQVKERIAICVKARRLKIVPRME